MPSIYDLKPGFQQLLRPLASGLHRGGVTANTVTLAAAIASVLFGAWMACASDLHLPFLFLPVFMLTRMALNAIDGILAREFGQKTRTGALLNEVGDVISDAALYAPFALLPGVRPELVMATIFLSILSEFVGVLGQVVGNSRRYDGPLGKSDRAALFGVLGLAIGLGWPVSGYFNLILVAVAGLLCWTIWSRARQAVRI